MTRQLAFDLPVRVSRSRGDFFVSDANSRAVARLEDTGGWPSGKLVLAGPEGSGKTHLGRVWAEANGGVPGTVGGLLSSDIPEIDTPVVLETGGERGFDPAEEEALFHFHNHMVAHRLPFLLLARTPPAQWPLKLPDLKSRMEATDVVRIEPPDDTLLAAVLVKHFADRQLAVAPAVVEWLVGNMERSFAEALRITAALDAAALEEGRAVTRPLAQRVLGGTDGTLT
jgi:chromosomal replication initiation ATPase DnaA